MTAEETTGIRDTLQLDPDLDIAVVATVQNDLHLNSRTTKSAHVQKSPIEEGSMLT